MSDILGEDFTLDLDEILTPEGGDDPTKGPDAISDPVVEPGDDDKTKPSPDPQDDDPDAIDMSLAFAEPDEDDDKGKGDDPEDPTERTPEGSPSSTNIAAYASALFEQGAFPDIDEEEIKNVKSVDDLIALNKKQIEVNKLAEVEGLTPLQKEALDAFRAGIDPAQFAQAKARELSYDNVTDEQLTDEQVAKQIITDYLTLNGTPEDVANDLIKSYELDEKLEAKAKEVLPKIKTKIKQQNELQIQEAKKQRDDAVKQIKESLDSVKEILPGTQISSKERTELFNQMTQPAKTLDDGTQLDAVMVKRQEDPVGFMMKLHYYTKLGLFDREVKTDVLKRKVKTDALKDFETKLNTGNSTTSMRGGDPRGRQEVAMFDFDEIPDVNPYKK